MIFVPRTALRQIVDAAEAAYPAECCGLLVGHARPTGELEVVRAVASRNHGKGNDRFEIDPQVWVDLTRALRGSPNRVVGLYHSHPDTPAQPSQADLESAWGEELAWLIVSVAGGEEGRAAQAVHISAHLLDHGGRQFREIALRSADWGPYPVRQLPDEARPT
jgi:proteasome lid subunit RPN8/RPN11